MRDAEAVRAGYDQIMAKARAYNPEAGIDGMQVQAMVGAGHEVIIGAVTDDASERSSPSVSAACWSRCSRT